MTDRHLSGWVSHKENVMRQEKEEWWNLVFEDCEYVGKTQRDYCLLRGISFEAFSPAKSRLRGTKRYIEPSMSLPICTVSLDLPSGKSINLEHYQTPEHHHTPEHY